MKAEILAVGTELLLGNIVNTNAQYLSRELSSLGMDVYYQSVVGDNPGRLRDWVKGCLDRTDVLILTGGLGPTGDDLTKETVCDCLGESLFLHEESLKRMQQYFQKIGREMTENNKKQAMLPKNAVVLPNDCGTAPGCLLDKKGKIVILLPGPPYEMEMMFERYAKPYLLKKADAVIQSRILRLFGIGESKAETLLKPLMEGSENPTLAPYAKSCEVHLRLTAKAENADKAQDMLDQLEQKVRDVVGEYVYGYEDQALQQVVISTLQKAGKTLSCAESCTGGLLAQLLTEVPGASEVFGFGFVTYANEAKQSLLQVPSEVLETYGAVSEPTALAMCRGARAAAGSDLAVSITGIAGPGGGSEEKPVGLVYIGLATEKGAYCKKLQLAGSRERIRLHTAMHALSMVLQELQK